MKDHSVLTLFCRFMLEWLSFAYRYVPFGLQKYPPQVKATLFCQACVVKIEPEFGHLLTGTPNKLNQYVFVLNTTSYHIFLTFRGSTSACPSIGVAMNWKPFFPHLMPRKDLILIYFSGTCPLIIL